MKLLGGPVRNAITVVPRKVNTCIFVFVVVEQGSIRYGLFHQRDNYDRDAFSHAFECLDRYKTGICALLSCSFLNMIDQLRMNTCRLFNKGTRLGANPPRYSITMSIVVLRDRMIGIRFLVPGHLVPQLELYLLLMDIM